MKKFWSFCLALLLLFSVCAGCGSKQKAAAPATPAPLKISQSVDTAFQKQTAAVATAARQTAPAAQKGVSVKKGAAYTDKEHVAAYLHRFKELPPNYIGKKEAQKLGWKTKGSLDKVAPGKSIGGDRYGNYERQLPVKAGRTWKECDIDYVRGSRNAKRIVFSDDGLIYYTGDHYKSFIRLY